MGLYDGKFNLLVSVNKEAIYRCVLVDSVTMTIDCFAIVSTQPNYPEYYSAAIRRFSDYIKTRVLYAVNPPKMLHAKICINKKKLTPIIINTQGRKEKGSRVLVLNKQ